MSTTRSNLVAPSPEALSISRPLPSKVRNRFTPFLSFLISWLVLAILWEIGAKTKFLNPQILPPPSVVIPYFIQGPGSAGIGPQQVSYGEAVISTLFRVLAGLFLGISAAIPLGTLVSVIPWAKQFVMPMVQTIAPIAPVAWIPLAIALVGTGDAAAVFVVFMGVFAVMTIATAAAISNVPRELLKTAESLGAKNWFLWSRVILPSTAPSLMTIIRVNFFAAWMAVLAGEMAGINSGLGALIVLGQQQFNMKLVMVGVITIGMLGFFIDRLLLLLQRRLLWWNLP